MASTWPIPPSVREMPYQEIPDSPTEKYYTDWRKYEEKLNLGEATSLDPIYLRTGNCVIKGNSPYTHDCTGISTSPWKVEEIPTKERMAAYHVYRKPAGFEITIEQEGDYTLLLPGGNGYTGYTLKVSTEPMVKANLTIIDTALQHGLKTQFIEIQVGGQSQLDVTHLVAHTENAPVYTFVKAGGGEGSRLIYRAGGRPGEMTRLRIDSLLNKPYSRVDGVLGFSSRGRSIGDIIFNVAHIAPHTVSLVSGNGVAREESKLTMRGTARVSHTAGSSRTRVEMHVIIVGDKAKGRSVPMLEIYTGEVEEASHSASATTIGENILFYAATRGLERGDLELLLERGVFEKAGVARIMEELGLA
ncbi:MAG: SufD family Fe-S cluster assembly protein [Desulfurococcales archaeon]|nr:SufD family Fe-S cluster assembly protein [Desulfurococcales archaeon]